MLLAHLVIVDRRAVRLLTLDFGARPAAVAGEPDLCRVCGGPLPRPDADQVVVACLYCRADNILGIDVRRDDEEARSAEKSLAETFDDRRRARTRSRAVASVAALVLVGGAAVLLRR